MLRPSQHPHAPDSPAAAAWMELVTDFLACQALPLETSVEEVDVVMRSHAMSVHVWCFERLEQEATIQDLVLRCLEAGGPANCPGPASETSLVYTSPSHVRPAFKTMSAAEIARVSARNWIDTSSYRREWEAMLKNLSVGFYGPVVIRGVHFGSAGTLDSRGIIVVHWPAVITDSAGQRWWGMINQTARMTEQYQLQWCLRDLLTIKHSPACISVVAQQGGTMLWQNAASMAMLGCHGQFNAEARTDADTEAALGSSRRARQGQQYSSTLDFIELLFGTNDDVQGSLQADMRRATEGGGTFRVTVEVVHPILRALMGLRGTAAAAAAEAADAADEDEYAGCCHLDCQVSLSRDPTTLQPVYVVSVVDVTATVVAQLQLQRAHARLEEEKARTEALLLRQYELIECLGWVSEVGSSAGGDRRAAQLIGEVRRQLSTRSERSDSGAAAGGEVIEMLGELGKGSYGKVSKALWRGNVVAVKSMMFPVKMTGAEKKERMAIMEAAISTSLEHPNLVRTFTYTLKPIREQKPPPSSSAGASEMQVGGPALPPPPPSPQRPPQQQRPRQLATQSVPGSPATVSAPLPVGPTALMPPPSSPQQQGLPQPALQAAPGAPGPGSLQQQQQQPRQQSRGSSAESLKQDQLQQQQQQPGAVCAFEVQLLLEYCDLGTLREALNAGIFHFGGQVNYPAVLDVAIDIARGMQHLHACNIIHADLKASNIMLQSNPRDPKGLTAKICDFGLSISKGDSAETHVSGAFQGTMTHMPPEAMLTGHQSNAGDVYSFAITLFELCSGERAFRSVPQALLGYQVAHLNRRPQLPPIIPNNFRLLCQDCWDPMPSCRPTFSEVLERLLVLRAAAGEQAEPLRVDVLKLVIANREAAAPAAAAAAAAEAAPAAPAAAAAPATASTSAPRSIGSLLFGSGEEPSRSLLSLPFPDADAKVEVDATLPAVSYEGGRNQVADLMLAATSLPPATAGAKPPAHQPSQQAVVEEGALAWPLGRLDSSHLPPVKAVAGCAASPRSAGRPSGSFPLPDAGCSKASSEPRSFTSSLEGLILAPASDMSCMYNAPPSTGPKAPAQAVWGNGRPSTPAVSAPPQGPCQAPATAALNCLQQQPAPPETPAALPAVHHDHVLEEQPAASLVVDQCIILTYALDDSCDR